MHWTWWGFRWLYWLSIVKAYAWCWNCGDGIHNGFLNFIKYSPWVEWPHSRFWTSGQDISVGELFASCWVIKQSKMLIPNGSWSALVQPFYRLHSMLLSAAQTHQYHKAVACVRYEMVYDRELCCSRGRISEGPATHGWQKPSFISTRGLLPVRSFDNGWNTYWIQ
jgi:hypothetical protein